MGDACAFIDGVSVIDKTRRQTARGLIPDLLRCMQGIQRVARDRSRDVSDSFPLVGLGARCSAIAAHLHPRRTASERKSERSNARDRAPSASSANRDVRGANVAGRTGERCQRPRLRLTRKTDREFNIHLKFTSRTNGCTGAAIPGEF